MKKMIPCLILILPILFLSCASIPEKINQEHSLAILPVQFDRSEVGQIFGDYRLSISSYSGEKVVMRKVMTTTKFECFELPPGKYIINKQQFIYNNGDKGSSYNPYVHFEVLPGKMTVMPQYFQYEFYKKKSTDSQYWMRARFYDMNKEAMTQLEEELSTEKYFLDWELTYTH